MEVEEAVRGAVLGVEAGQAAVQGRELPGGMETIKHHTLRNLIQAFIQSKGDK